MMHQATSTMPWTSWVMPSMPHHLSIVARSWSAATTELLLHRLWGDPEWPETRSHNPALAGHHTALHRKRWDNSGFTTPMTPTLWQAVLVAPHDAGRFDCCR